ncbi:hypothetical protein K0M31_007493 [Melipona bicolor]|uniref:Uncharacterized protein n=1 Tax=Melipona bicolor TaxID=60889 RepID=A0AA40KW16_9HYME|nr:hypothetical protein K0M31_007493 [Melipona bicolor]
MMSSEWNKMVETEEIFSVRVKFHFFRKFLRLQEARRMSVLQKKYYSMALASNAIILDGNFFPSNHVDIAHSTEIHRLVMRILRSMNHRDSTGGVLCPIGTMQFFQEKQLSTR